MTTTPCSFIKRVGSCLGSLPRSSGLVRATSLWLLSVAAACSAAVEDRCGPVEETPGPLMRPGQNCLSCHQQGFGDDDAPIFSAAGTVFDSADADRCDGVAGVKVYLTAASGEEIELVTNAAGNFWTREALMPEGPGPRIEFGGRTLQMQRHLPSIPACNACHDNPPVGGAPGKIFVP